MGKIRCSCCRDGYAEHKDFIRGGVEIDDFEEEPRYRKPNGGSWRRKSRPCKKSKTGDKCDFSATTIHGIKRDYRDVFIDGKWTSVFVGTSPRVIRCCVRCGKFDWSSLYTF